jgi:hypothetical protein
MEDGPSLLADVTEMEMFLFLALIFQVGHDLRQRLTDCWSKTEQFYTPLYSHTLKWDRCLHTQCFYHFEDLPKETGKNDDENHDRLRKIDTFLKF